MPWGLADAFSSANDPTPYQFGYVDRNQIADAYFYNLLPEITIFEFNGFYPQGLSLHSTTNRLPWDDDSNYRIIGAAAARAGFRWVSVTSQAFSVGPDSSKTDPNRVHADDMGGADQAFTIGPDPSKTDPDRFNTYDMEVTSRQRSRRVIVSTGWASSRSILVVPTSWRDHIWSYSSEPEDLHDMYTRMHAEIEKQWRVARENGLALVLLFHPVKFVGKPFHDDQFFEFRRTLLERAKQRAVPVMTFSDYADRLASMQ